MGTPVVIDIDSSNKTTEIPAIQSSSNNDINDNNNNNQITTVEINISNDDNDNKYNTNNHHDPISKKSSSNKMGHKKTSSKSLKEKKLSNQMMRRSFRSNGNNVSDPELYMTEGMNRRHSIQMLFGNIFRRDSWNWEKFEVSRRHEEKFKFKEFIVWFVYQFFEPFSIPLVRIFEGPNALQNAWFVPRCRSIKWTQFLLEKATIYLGILVPFFIYLIDDQVKEDIGYQSIIIVIALHMMKCFVTALKFAYLSEASLYRMHQKINK